MKAQEINSVLDKFNKLKVLIIGDIMLDTYRWGKVNRISPEAPVPIVQVKKEENRLGGAANVAQNIQALGAKAYLFSVIGSDEAGKNLSDILEKKQIDTSHIIKSKNRKTTIKTRVISGNQQLLRIDDEIISSIDKSLASKMLAKIEKLLPKIDVVILQDYDKGVFYPDFIKNILEKCQAAKVPVAADPKKNNFLEYKDIQLFKPNLKELQDGLKINLQEINLDNLIKAAKKLNQNINAEILLITLSEHGVFYFSNGNGAILPAHLRKIADVSGAGDTVISLAVLCLALKLPAEFIASMANLAGGLVCEDVGVVPINKEKFKVEALFLTE